MTASSRLYFRQLLAGRDFAQSDTVARSMANYAYIIGDARSGEAIVVDPAYRPAEVVACAHDDGLRVVGVVATHYHPDHIGGSLAGWSISGVADLLTHWDVPVHAQAAEVGWIVESAGVDAAAIVAHAPGDRLAVGELDITLIHAPGHTPGSQCLLVEDHLVTGDVLFLQGCGRTDLPGSDPAEMYRTLSERLAAIPAGTWIYAGHAYDPVATDTFAHVRATNAVLAPMSAQQWRAAFA